ncbi:MAG: AAA family ATPase [Candidatus Obscuribacterales bacterium]|nr:AAA family ATPase [Candidatus Obscuribacterales bacterium]
MWIEKLTLYGFGGIANEQIKFGENDLNLIVERNEYGKSTLAEGIWATLFDFPDHASKNAHLERDAFKPWVESAPYKASLDVFVEARPLRIERDFSNKTFKVIDKLNNTDVTQEFIGPNGEDQVGLKVTGMSRDLFRNTCLLGQRHLDAHHASSTNDIGPVFRGMADTSNPVSTASGAIDALQDALNNYSFAAAGARRMSIEEAIVELESAKNDIHQKLTTIEQERMDVANWLDELSRLEKQIQSAVSTDPLIVSEFDMYRIQCREAAHKLDGALQRSQQKQGLEEQLNELDRSSPITGTASASLQDLWTRRSSRQGDADKLEREFQPQEQRYEELSQEISNRYQNLESFTQEEVNLISTFAVNLFKLQEQLVEVQRQHQEQTGRHLHKLLSSTQQHGQALDTLKSLSKDEIDEAKNYSSLLIMFHDQVQEEQKKLQEIAFSLEDIEERRKSKRSQNVGLLIGAIVLLVGMIAALLYTHEIKDFPAIVNHILMGIAALAWLAAMIFVPMIFKYQYFLKDDANSANEEGEKRKKALQGVKQKMVSLEGKLQEMAERTGAGTKDELVRIINDASSHESVVQEQQGFDSTLSTEESRIKKVEADLAYYFEKAGLDPNDITSQKAMDLSQDITQSFKDREDLEKQFEDIAHGRKQLEFLITEIADIDDQIESLLIRSGIDLSEVEDIEGAIDELIKVNVARQKILAEMARLEYDLAGFDDLIQQVESLQYEKDVLEDKIRNLISEHPELEDLPEPDPNEKKQSILPWGQTQATTDKSELRKQKEELILQVRATVNNHDEHYLEIIEELATVDHELNCARRARLALSMAKEVIQQLSSETYGDWSQKLNDESRELISQLAMDIESLAFDQSLQIVLKLQGHQRQFNAQDIATKLSTGTREQVNWLARIILSRFLSKRQSLPIVLDEPFSEADDERFLNMMRFLIRTISPNNQIIILSCHHQRHQWLVTQLASTEKAKLSFRNRLPIAAAEVESSVVR